MNHIERHRRTFLHAVALASVALSVGDSGAQAGDSVLIGLKRDLDLAHIDLETAMTRRAENGTFEADQALDHACDRHLDIITRIESVPATTLDGLKVKLSALDDIYAWDPGGVSIDSLSAEPTTDMRLIVQILDTLRGL